MIKITLTLGGDDAALLLSGLRNAEVEAFSQAHTAWAARNHSANERYRAHANNCRRLQDMIHKAIIESKETV